MLTLPEVWTNPLPPADRVNRTPLRRAEVEDASARLAWFRPLLAQLFAGDGWDGAIGSPLLDWPGDRDILVKGDHLLPMTGSIKARGGVYEVLEHVETLLRAAGLLVDGAPAIRIADSDVRRFLAERTIAVASTGNLGFSVGLVARRLGMRAQVHMSHDAKRWKKERLAALGAEVVEHACDYAGAVARARTLARQIGAHFVDDEDSRSLFVGYATAAAELAGQLADRGIVPGAGRRLIVHLPCGVGGAPGGIAAGLKLIFAEAVVAVMVEPDASPCMLAALDAGFVPVSVYDRGADNVTVADGLAVPIASALVLDSGGRSIDVALRVSDAVMIGWVRRAWSEANLRLEPSAAASLASVEMFRDAGLAASGDIHVAWATGGGLVPDAEFALLLA